MITPEIMLVIVFTLLASAIYVLYRYFDDLIKCFQQEVVCLIENAAENSCAADCKKRTDLLEQKLKDGLQSNAVCCRSAIDSGRSLIDKINSRIAILEKNQTGSIKVVKRETPKKEIK